jgi:hypothetical protein
MGHAERYPQSFPCGRVASRGIATKLGEFPKNFSMEGWDAFEVCQPGLQCPFSVPEQRQVVSDTTAV